MLFKVLFSCFAKYDMSDWVTKSLLYVLCTMCIKNHVSELLSVWMFGINNCWMGFDEICCDIMLLYANLDLYDYF